MRKALYFTVLGAVLLAACSVAPAQTGKDEERAKPAFSAGIVLSGEASAKSVGLPIMPGAVRREKGDDESNGLTFALWGGEFGFKVAVLQLATTEPIDQVADYYKREMRRYGAVMDCSAGRISITTKGDQTSMTCEEKTRIGGKYVFKVGTKNNHRLVNIEPSGNQVHIDMVRVVTTD